MKNIKPKHLRIHMARARYALSLYIERYLDAIVGPRVFHTSLIACGYLPGRAPLHTINCVGFYRMSERGPVRVVDANDTMRVIEELGLEDLWALARLLKKVRGSPKTGPRPDLYSREKSPRFDYWLARAYAGFRPNKRYRMEGLSGRALWLGVTIWEAQVLDEIFEANLKRPPPPGW